MCVAYSGARSADEYIMETLERVRVQAGRDCD